MEQETTEMKSKSVDFTPDQFKFFREHRKRTGIPANHFIRVAVDKEIQRLETEEKKIQGYQK